MTTRWPRPLFYVVTLLALIADQATKLWATAALRPWGSIEMLPGLFNLTYVRNRGIAFGLFAGEGLLIGVFMIVLAVVTIYYSRSLNWRLLEPNMVGGLLCGGALGNLLDRARLGYVVDFFDCYIGVHHWPVFNVADSLICLSVAWIVVRQLGIGHRPAPISE